jgi:hypothetical protein
MCSKWLVIPPTGKGARRYFTTEAQANAYASKYPGATIKPPKKK